MARSVADHVGAALDAGFARAAPPGFARLARSDGISLRRWFRGADGRQCEIAVHRDKWWTRDGGRIAGEAFLLVDSFQAAMGGGAQSWLDPDYARPLHHFQYRASSGAVEFTHAVDSSTAPGPLADAFAAWLDSHLLPWLEAFRDDDGVFDHLMRQRAFAAAAELAARTAQRERATAALVAFCDSLPRNADAQLARLREAGLLHADEVASLRFASMQREDEYRDAVAAWRAARFGA